MKKNVMACSTWSSSISTNDTIIFGESFKISSVLPVESSHLSSLARVAREERDGDPLQSMSDLH